MPSPLNCTLVTVFYSASLKVANGEAACTAAACWAAKPAWSHQRARGSAASISPRLWRSRQILLRSDGLAHAHRGENEERRRQTEYDEGAKDTIALLLGRELGRQWGGQLKASPDVRELAVGGRCGVAGRRELAVASFGGLVAHKAPSWWHCCCWYTAAPPQHVCDGTSSVLF